MSDNVHLVAALAAAFAGELEALREALPISEIARAKSPSGKTFLHVAAEAGHVHVIRFLLGVGCAVRATTAEGETPLHFAARGRISGHPLFGVHSPWDPAEANEHRTLEDAILQLVKRDGLWAPPSFAAIDGLPRQVSGPLYDAVLARSLDHPRLHRELVAAGIPFDARDPVFRFLRGGYPDYPEVIRTLASHGALLDAKDEVGRTPLHFAAESPDPRIAAALLELGAAVNGDTPATHGWPGTPMQAAIEYSNVAVAALLRLQNVRVDFAACPLHHAAANGRTKILVWLLDSAGGDIEQRDVDGNTPLLRAVCGHEEVVAALLARGASVSAVNHQGETVLHLSAGWPEGLAGFLEHPVDPAAADAKGRTPLHHAALVTAHDSIPLLLAKGVRIDAQDRDGQTPLHVVFGEEELRPDMEFETFQALVAGGADRGIRDHKGRTAYDLAVGYAYPDKYLELLRPI